MFCIKEKTTLLALDLIKTKMYVNSIQKQIPEGSESKIMNEMLHSAKWSRNHIYFMEID